VRAVLETGRFSQLAGQTFDLIVIGGGIIGCGIARDAALRGLRIALFEREDFGYGTSSRSTRLIHGGLRYLEQFDFRLVRQDLREREILLRIAPHRVRPLPFLVPLYDRSWFYRFRLRLGMILYDLLSYDKSLPKHRFLSREETLQAESGLRPEGLQGAARYYDAQAAFPERLCLDNALDAAAHGAFVFNHAAVVGLLREEGRVGGVRVRDTLTGEEAEARANIVVNAAGPWLDALVTKLTGQPTAYLRLTKGIHFAAPPAVQNALVLFSGTDDRLFFVIPWLGYAWVGTTDTDFRGDLDTVCATRAEVDYLRATVQRLLPDADWQTVYFTTAGVRALVRDHRPDARESDVSRQHRVIVHTAAEGLAGLISILGGKLTAYRDIAREVVETAVAPLSSDLPPNPFPKGKGREEQIPPPPSPSQGEGALSSPLSCSVGEGAEARAHRGEVPGGRAASLTATRPLPGGDFTDVEALLREAYRQAGALGLEEAQAAHLVFLYGTRYTEILDLIREQPERGARLAAGTPDVRAQVAHAVACEFAQTACDFLMRRTTLFFTPDQGQAAAPAVVAEMRRLLGWDEARCQSEMAAYRAQVALAQTFRQETPTVVSER